MEKNYKKPLTIKEQIQYLEDEKKVVFRNVSKSEAESILYQNNYINVISPYKHRFYKKDEKGAGIKDKGNHHIYEKKVDFKEYADAYFNERNKYPTIYKNIMKFETTMNAIVSYEVINGYAIDSYNAFEAFIDDMIKNAGNMKLPVKAKDHYLRYVDELKRSMPKYEDIYILLDRMTLMQTITLYKCARSEIQKKIFDGLINANATFGYYSAGSFDDFLKRIVMIRNCISHFNSLEILVKYYNVKTKEYRKDADKKKYMKVIAKLSDNDKSLSK